MRDSSAGLHSSATANYLTVPLDTHLTTHHGNPWYPPQSTPGALPKPLRRIAGTPLGPQANIPCIGEPTGRVLRTHPDPHSKVAFCGRLVPPLSSIEGLLKPVTQDTAIVTGVVTS